MRFARRYAYTFKDQQVVTRKGALRAGDYGVMLAEALLATVERKSLGDLVSSLTTGKLKYQLADLAAVPRAAVVVEERYSQVFKSQHVRPAVIADGLAELAQARPLAPPDSTPAEVRAWALARGIPVSDRGRIKREVVEAYRADRFSTASPGTPDRETTVTERESTMPHGDVGTLHNDGKWHNVIEGTDQVSEPFDTLEEAVAEGREMARDLGVDHIVKNLDGTIADRNSYSDDSR